MSRRVPVTPLSRAPRRRRAAFPAEPWRGLFRVAERHGWYTAGEPLVLQRALERGVPKSTLVAVLGAATTDDALRRALRDRIVPRATWNRRGRALSRAEGERTLRLARVVALAEWVWDDAADARRFLATPHPRLGGKRPLELLDSEPGALAVERELFALELGHPA